MPHFSDDTDADVKTVSQQVQERLLELVLLGRLTPGSWVRENDLAALLGVSRTPVREAVRSLVEQGLIEALPNRGARVRRLTPEDVRNVYGLRQVLESYAASEAAARRTDADVETLNLRLDAIAALPVDDVEAHVRADDAFHHAIMVMAGNPLIAEFGRSLALRVMRLKMLTGDTNASARTRRDHEHIVACIGRGDAEGAATTMRRHIATYQSMLLDRLSETGDAADTLRAGRA